jgi:hypothetical protein
MNQEMVKADTKNLNLAQPTAFPVLEQVNTELRHLGKSWTIKNVKKYLQKHQKTSINLDALVMNILVAKVFEKKVLVFVDVNDMLEVTELPDIMMFSFSNHFDQIIPKPQEIIRAIHYLTCKVSIFLPR